MKLRSAVLAATLVAASAVVVATGPAGSQPASLGE
jgi:hypothetical protein